MDRRVMIDIQNIVLYTEILKIIHEPFSSFVNFAIPGIELVLLYE